MSRIVFGTDGWRAVMAEDFTFENVERVTQAAAGLWTARPPAGCKRRVVVGFDTRFQSDRFALRAAEVFLGNGFEVVLTPSPAPTPAVSFAVKRLRATGGVMITASHNPPWFNGLKIKTHLGGPADGALCREIESWLDRAPARRQAWAAAPSGTARKRDLAGPHLEQIGRMVDLERISRAGLRVAHDALFGAGIGCVARLLEGTGCQVTPLNHQPDPMFGGANPEPVERNCHSSQAFLRRNPHDICLITDGDSDRIGALDGRGGYVGANVIICLLLAHLIQNRGRAGRIVKVLNTTSMMDRIAQRYGLPLTEVGVGFKHTYVEMLKGDVLLGGEESGSIGFGGHIPERDGLLAGAYLLEMLAMEGRPVQALARRLERQFGPHRYARRDLVFPLDRREALMDRCGSMPPGRLLRSPVEKVQTFDGVKYTARNGSWLMLRGSGTEPVLRVYAEAGSDDEARRLVRQGIALSRAVL